MSNEQNQKSDSLRSEFLLHMYDQLFNDINRHINIVWQPITTLIGAVSLFAAGKADIVSIDVAEALIILLVGWLVATLYDSSYWYNRNLVIIANIERQFLRQSDLKHIHYYFGEHRSNSMLTHLRIHKTMGIFIGLLIVLHHLFTEVIKVIPKINAKPEAFRYGIIFPYVAIIIASIWVAGIRKQRIDSYSEFLKNSPGIPIDTTGIDYGVGHPTDVKKPKA